MNSPCAAAMGSQQYKSNPHRLKGWRAGVDVSQGTKPPEEDESSCRGGWMAAGTRGERAVSQVTKAMMSYQRARPSSVNEREAAGTA